MEAGTRVQISTVTEKIISGKLAIPYDGEGPVILISGAGKQRIIPAAVIESVEER